MSQIIPRWEWRRFGHVVEDVESTLGPLVPDRVQESDELYVLSTRGNNAVKVRDDLMDVKRLLAVSEQGLEQWSPVMKAGSPLSTDQVRLVLEALRVDAPPPAGRAAYTFEDVVEALLRPHPELLVVEVHKRRQRYTIHGCLAELTDVVTADASTRTLAIESEDPTTVIAAVSALGLTLRPNVGFTRGLKSLLRFGIERYAVIDVGTNSVKFHVGERTASGAWRRIVDRAVTSRLGEGLQETGRLNQGPIERTVEAIAAMVEEAWQNGAAEIAAVGTAGLRIAPNSADFLDAVRTRSGVTVEVISGEEESRLAYLGARAGVDQAGRASVVFDTGGGSSQFTFGRGDQVDERFSVNVGAVRYTEAFGLDAVVSEKVLADALAAIDHDLGRLDDRDPPDSLLAMGGAVTNLAAVKHGLAEYDPDIVQGTVLDLAEIDRQIERYRTSRADERRTVVGLQPQRADIILAGACIVRTVLRKLGQDSLTVSDRGLRHGVLMERFG